jgi:hypothetical protein
MNLLESEDINLTDLVSHYLEKSKTNDLDILRVKKFYSNKEEFNELMNRLIKKDEDRFKRLMDKDPIPNPWRIFGVILDIVLHEGKTIMPFDTLTQMFPSKSVEYMDWVFSWVHGDTTIISVYNPDCELIYRF